MNDVAQAMGVAWFGRNAEAGTCHCCQKATRVYRGYNGGQYVAVTLCDTCRKVGHQGCEK